MKILLIDDDPDVVDVVDTLLSIYWPDTLVLTAGYGSLGLTLVREESPDVVILDLGLPDTDGIKVLKDIREFSQVPVLILTVRHSQDETIRALDIGADDYVLKPFSHLVLLARVKAVYERGVMSAALADRGNGPTIYGNQLTERAIPSGQ